MSKKNKKAKHHPDRDLIEACMDYCAGSAAFHAAFFADPDGNSAFAEARRDKMGRCALKVATKLQAQTMLGLSSKARAAVYMLERDLHSLDAVESKERDFLLSLAKDVKRFSDKFEGDRFREAATAVAMTAAA
jgi:hypothetical protein